MNHCYFNKSHPGGGTFSYFIDYHKFFISSLFTESINNFIIMYSFIFMDKLYLKKHKLI